MKRKPRMAWGLSALLALVLVSGLPALFGYAQWTREFSVQWQPVANWRMMSLGVSHGVSLDALAPKNEAIADFYCLGPVQVFVPRHHQ